MPCLKCKDGSYECGEDPCASVGERILLRADGEAGSTDWQYQGRIIIDWGPSDVPADVYLRLVLTANANGGVTANPDVRIAPPSDDDDGPESRDHTA